jgi:hypothetical protein
MRDICIDIVSGKTPKEKDILEDLGANGRTIKSGF